MGVNKVRFSPDGKTLVFASADNSVRLWSTNDASNVKILPGHTKRVTDVSFSPDGKIIASVSWDQTIKLWNKDGTLRKTIYGHSAGVESVSFSSDGQMIASASRDRKIKIWNLDGILINSIDIYKGEIYSVSFSPKDKFLVAGVDDGQVRLWDIELNNLQAKACNHLKNYLQNNPNSIESENQDLCDRVEPSATAFFLHGEQLALQGRIDDAIANFEKAVKLDSNLIYLASDWNKLCWMGSLNQQPQKFIVACDKAVQLEPNNRWIRKSRGVARALIGNFNGAVLDFEESIKLISDENEKTKQKDWIESLKKAKNPFTNEVLKNFRSE
ncbi:WD40 domain-containing protein [Microcoleus sp. D3_18_C4]|uniref:WD40 domain-containing protein n=1 Tax=Microcoleus sp. D3_18_C4 TaxID=3055335 RepID=UPI002FD5E9B3